MAKRRIKLFASIFGHYRVLFKKGAGLGKGH